MGIPVLVIGKSGSGKTASLRNFKKDEIGIFNVASKPLPFKNDFITIDKPSYTTIEKSLKRNKLKTYIIDDSQYLMAFESFEKASEKGYNKFTEMAVNFYNLIQAVITETPNDTIVYFLHHSQESEYGIKAKTIGKMLDDQLTVEGLFSIVLMAINSSGEYKFLTHSDGKSTVKTPIGMFEEKEIDNDLKIVDTTIRDFYNLGGNKNEEV